MANKIAIVGLGIMGRRMLHNAMIHPQFDVSGVWDPSTESVDKAREVMPDLPLSDSAEQAMAGADVAYLACPPVPRKAYALHAAQAGLGVFMEKPLGVDNASSQDLVDRLAEARLPGVVNFTQAASRGFDVLRNAVNNNETGELVGIDIVVTYPTWPRQWQVDADWLRFNAEGGYTREVISHFLFLATRFLGPLELVAATPRYPVDPVLCEQDIVAMQQTRDGRPVTVLGTTGGAQPDRQEVTVKGTKQSFQFREFFQLWRSDGGPWVEAIDWSNGEDPRISALQRQLTEADKWLHGKPHLLATAQEALDVQLLVEAMLKGRAK